MLQRRFFNGLTAGVMIAVMSMNVITYGAPVNGKVVTQTVQVLTTQQKLDDIAFFCSQLEKLHPDMYHTVTKEVFQEKRSQLEKKAEKLSKEELVYELQMLSALIGDAHTNLNVTQATQEVSVFPIQLKKIEGKWIVMAVISEEKSQLGKEVTAIDGIPMEKVVAQLAPFVSYETEGRLNRQLRNILIRANIMHYMGVTKSADKAVFTIKDSNGTTSDITIKAVKEEVDMTSLGSTIKEQPITKFNKPKIYFDLELEPETLYIQYNSCREDKELPMKKFVSQIEAKMKKENYKKVIIDLRNNTGGSDGVIVPLIEKLLELKKTQNFETYGLIGEATFSSAVINAAMLKEAGFTLVGTPTGNTANHFGSVKSFQLPNLLVDVQYSTKFIDLTTLLPSAKIYKDGPVVPDISIVETLSDYLSGKDIAVETILKK